MSTHKHHNAPAPYVGVPPSQPMTHGPVALCARAGVVLAMDQWMVGVVTVR